MLKKKELLPIVRALSLLVGLRRLLWSHPREEPRTEEVARQPSEKAPEQDPELGGGEQSRLFRTGEGERRREVGHREANTSEEASEQHPPAIERCRQSRQLELRHHKGRGDNPQRLPHQEPERHSERRPECTVCAEIQSLKTDSGVCQREGRQDEEDHGPVEGHFDPRERREQSLREQRPGLLGAFRDLLVTSARLFKLGTEVGDEVSDLVQGHPGLARDEQTDQNARQGGVEARLVEADPGDDPGNGVPPPGAQPMPAHEVDECERTATPHEERQHTNGTRVEDVDDEDRTQVISDREGQQKDAQGRRNTLAEQHQYADGERDVRRGRDRDSTHVR